MFISLPLARHSPTMLDDYEAGIRRKPSRHTVGRMRWVLLASIFLNLLLFYKYWSSTTKIVVLEQDVKKLNSDLVTESKQIEHYKKQTMLTEERRTNCEKRLSEIEDKSQECQLRHKDCSDTLESTSAKLMEMNQSVKSLAEEKDRLNAEVEEQAEELESVKEQVTGLQNELQKYERSQTNQPIVMKRKMQPEAPEDDKFTTLKKEATKEQPTTIQDINAVNQGDKDRAGEGSDKKIVETQKTRLADSTTSEPAVFIDCDFTEASSDKGKCNYRKQPLDSPWEFGRPAFLEEHSTQCLYLDDSATVLGKKSSILFQTVETDKCLLFLINTTIVGGGQMSVQDNGESYDVTMKNENVKPPVWEMKRINLKAAPSHAVEISGIINQYGGIAVTKVLLTEGECEADIKNEAEVDENDKEIIDDLA